MLTAIQTRKAVMTSYSRRCSSAASDHEDTTDLKLLIRNIHGSAAYHRHRYQKSSKKKGKQSQLKDFPVNVLDNICSNISIHDIISLSLTCSALKKKVEPNIYKHMRIMDLDYIADEEELIIQRHFGNFKDEVLETESWWVYHNMSSITDAKSVLLLIYNILTNPTHGRFIKTIEINRALKPSPWKRCKDDETSEDNSVWSKTLDHFLSPEELKYIANKLVFFNSKLSLFDCLLLLLDYTLNLENLIVSKFSLNYVSKLLLKIPNLKQLKIMVYENENFTELPLQNLKKLTKLRLKFQENTESLLERISCNFNNFDILSRLEVLQLKFDKTDFNHLSAPTWFSFFKPLLNNPNDQDFIFKSLKKLELKDCFFGSNQSDYVSKLAALIPFSQIEWLSLQVYEYSHKGIKHADCSSNDSLNHKNTVLSYLSPHLANITDLRIKPTKNCKNCQIESIICFLNKHRNMRNIWLSTDSLNKENYKKILGIFTNYKNLQRLAYFDEFINNKLINNLKNWFIFEHGVIDFDIFKCYESETLRQDIDPLFDCYRIDEFKNFNERESDLLILFWQHFLNEFGLDSLMGKRNGGASELKLFGYNFKVDRCRKVILLYISKEVGYVDLVYY